MLFLDTGICFMFMFQSAVLEGSGPSMSTPLTQVRNSFPAPLLCHLPLPTAWVFPVVLFFLVLRGGIQAWVGVPLDLTEEKQLSADHGLAMGDHGGMDRQTHREGQHDLMEILIPHNSLLYCSERIFGAGKKDKKNDGLRHRILFPNTEG